MPIFLENAYEAKADCVTVHGSDAVLESLKRDIFNDRTWPDFVAMSGGPAPFLKLERLEPGRPLEVEGLRITPIPVNHVVPTMGFLVEDGRTAVLIASDTGPTDLLWARAKAYAGIDAVSIRGSHHRTDIAAGV